MIFKAIIHRINQQPPTYNSDWKTFRKSLLSVNTIYTAPAKISLTTCMEPKQLNAYIREVCLGTFDYSVATGAEAYTYHQRMHNKNQLILALQELVKNPASTRAAITLREANDITSEHPPCLTSVVLNIDSSGLNVSQYWRSRDMWNAFEPNLVALTYLWLIVSKVIKQPFSKIYDHTANAHIYEKDFASVRGALERPKKLQQINLQEYYDLFEEELLDLDELVLQWKEIHNWRD